MGGCRRRSKAYLDFADFISTLVVESTVHHLDVIAQLPGKLPPTEQGLRVTVETIEGLVGTGRPFARCLRRPQSGGAPRSEVDLHRPESRRAREAATPLVDLVPAATGFRCTRRNHRPWSTGRQSCRLQLLMTRSTRTGGRAGSNTTSQQGDNADHCENDYCDPHDVHWASPRVSSLLEAPLPPDRALAPAKRDRQGERPVDVKLGILPRGP